MEDEKSTSEGSDLRARLIRAAMDILDDPETPLDLRKVAEAAGKSRTAPYLVFGKESEGGGLSALRMAVAAEGAEMMAGRMEAARATRDDPRLAFELVSRALFGFATGRQRLFRLMFGAEIGTVSPGEASETARHPEFDRLVEARTRAERVVLQVVRAAQAERIVPEGDPLRHSIAAWALLIGIAFLLIDPVLEAAGVETSVEEGARLATEIFMGTHAEAITKAALALVAAEEHKARPDPPPRRIARSRAFRDFAVPADEAVSDEPAVSAMDPFAVRESGPEFRRAYERAGRTISTESSLRRAALVAPALRGARVLWIDDRPDGLRWERRTLEELGVSVTSAVSTEAALERLAADPFDLIISDIARGDRPDEGVRALPRLREVQPDTAVVFYIADLDPERGPPEGSAGITNRTGDLLHLVLDVLERRRL